MRNIINKKLIQENTPSITIKGEQGLSITEYLSQQEPERQALLTSIHEIIVKTNPKVSPEFIAGNDGGMIQYKIKGLFEYHLSSQPGYMTLHSMSMYNSWHIQEKYAKLLNKAKFRKGFIDFKNAEEMPLDIVEKLLTDCAKIKWATTVTEKYRKRKFKKK